MELKVQIDNSSRLVCGLNDETTVHDVIVALANSLNETGRFYLIEKVSSRYSRHRRASFKVKSRRLNEPRIMAPAEKPIQILRAKNRSLGKNEFIEFHLFKSKYLTLENDEFSEQMIERELLEKLNNLVDAPVRKGSRERYFQSAEKSILSQRGLRHDETNKIDQNFSTLCNSSFDDTSTYYNSNNVFQSYSNTSRSNLSSPVPYSNSTTTSNDSNSFVTDKTLEKEVNNENSMAECQSLLTNITTQQSVLEGQSYELDGLLKNIENQEISLLHLNQKNENFKVTLNNLELLNCLNATKLDDLERETNQMNLLKEIELNDFLRAQRDYYERRLSEVSFKFEKEKAKLDESKVILEKLNNQAEPDANNSVNMQIPENKLILEDLNAANRKFQLNKARLDYLEVSSSNLETSISGKANLVRILEDQLLIDTLNQKTEELKVSEFTETAPSRSSSPSNQIKSQESLVEDTESMDKPVEENEDCDSICSIETTSSEASTSREAMASFLKYKKIRERSLMEKRRNAAGANANKNSNDTFNEVFNTVHYF